MTKDKEYEYIPATSAMTTHLRVLAEMAEEALASHASLVEGLERSIREASRHDFVVDDVKAGHPEDRAHAEPPRAPHQRRQGAVMTALSSLVGKIAFA